MSLAIDQCTACGQACFPTRYCCPQCGGAQWRQVPAGEAHVAQATVVRARVGLAGTADLHLVSIQLRSGPVLIAQTTHALVPGTEVALHMDPEQRIFATPCTSSACVF